jgi:hypothetical protein
MLQEEDENVDITDETEVNDKQEDFDDEDDPEDRDLTLQSYGSVKFDGLFALGVLTIKSLDLIPVLDE